PHLQRVPTLGVDQVSCMADARRVARRGPPVALFRDVALRPERGDLGCVQPREPAREKNDAIPGGRPPRRIPDDSVLPAYPEGASPRPEVQRPPERRLY